MTVDGLTGGVRVGVGECELLISLTLKKMLDGLEPVAGDKIMIMGNCFDGAAGCQRF